MSRSELRVALGILIGVGLALLIGCGLLSAAIVINPLLAYVWALAFGSAFLGALSLWAASGVHVALRAMASNHVG